MRIIGNNPQLSRQTQGTASGAITGGKPVVVNTDGTVTQISATANSASTGTAAKFDDEYARKTRIAYDTNTDKFVIIYRDDGNSNYGTAIVGTISDTSISYGTAVVFESANSNYLDITFDSNANKVLIVYQDDGNSGQGTAIVGTVSGTSISFGSPTVFDTSDTKDCAVAFDSALNKSLVIYKRSSTGRSRILTISGTSVSAGNDAEFESGNVSETDIDFITGANKFLAVFEDTSDSQKGKAIVGTIASGDSTISYGSVAVYNTGRSELNKVINIGSSKAVIVYRDHGNSLYGTAVVATISSTSVSFGSAVVFKSNQINALTILYNSSDSKVYVMYADASASDALKMITGTISGTSISFADEITLDSSTTANINGMYIPDGSKGLIAFNNGSSDGMAIIRQFASTNLSASTSEAFIGFAEDTVATGQPVTINTKGAIDENQSSLTPAQQYFVQTDGTLGTSADDPSVVAGTAVTATKLIVKG